MGQKCENFHSTQKVDCDVSSGTMPLCNFDFSQLEISFLTVFRLVCSNYSKNLPKVWDQAHVEARQLNSKVKPDLLVGAVCDIARAIKADRSLPFEFLNTNCSHCQKLISGDEFVTILVVRGAIDHDPKTLYSSAIALTRSSSSDRVLCAARKLALLMNANRQQSPVSQEGTAIPETRFLH